MKSLMHKKYRKAKKQKGAVLMTDRISPTSDLGFKKILTDRPNKDVLQGLIKDFFEIDVPLDDITVTEPYDIKVYQEYLQRLNGREEISEKLRQTVQDVAADIKIADFGAEVQVRKDIYLIHRVLYYCFSRFCSNYNLPGKMAFGYDGLPIRYSSLKPLYMLNILDYRHFTDNGDDDALRIFSLYDPKRNKSFSVEYLLLAFFELQKSRVETSNQRFWQVFFRTGEAPEDAPEHIRKAAQVIEMVNMTGEEREMYDKLQRAKDTYDSIIYTAQIEGEKIGEARGINKGKPPHGRAREPSMR
jgi:hypothetical protein